MPTDSDSIAIAALLQSVKNGFAYLIRNGVDVTEPRVKLMLLDDLIQNMISDKGDTCSEEG